MGGLSSLGQLPNFIVVIQYSVILSRVSFIILSALGVMMVVSIVGVLMVS